MKWRKSARVKAVSPWHDLTARLVLRARDRSPETTVFLLTSCETGEGTSTVTREVAALASESGMRVGVLEIKSPEPSGRSLTRLDTALDFSPEVGAGVARWSLPESFSALPTVAREPRAWVKGLELMLIDAPPIGSFMQQHLSALVDGVVIVAHSRKRRLAEVVRAAKVIADDGGALLGVVLNRHKTPIPRWLDMWGDRP